MSPMLTLPFGPFTAGVHDTANPSVPQTGALRDAQNVMFTGVFDLSLRPGTQQQLILFDDQGLPESITGVVAIVPFGDGALAVGWSSITEKCYLYRLKNTMDNWYDINGNAGGVFHDYLPHPIGVLWSSMPSRPDVSITEGLGTAYIANTEAADVNGLYWPTKTYDDYGTATVTDLSGTTLIFPATFANAATVAITKNGTPLVNPTDYTQSGSVFTLVVAAITSDVFILTYSAGIDTLLVNGSGGDVGTDTAYFNGVVAFQQACWGFGYGAGSEPGYTSYRPELARFSPPDFDPFQVEDSLTIGDRVRSERERIIAGIVAGNSLYLGGASLLTRITGYGRDSWYRTVLDRSYGFVGPKCAVAVGSTLYYWSPQGPIRVDDGGAPDPLWDAIPAAVASVANLASIVAAFDLDTNHVLFFYDTGTGVRTFCAFDVRRSVWLGPDSDIGLSIVSAGAVTPLYASTAVAPDGPAGPPTIISTTMIGTTTAIATWANGDGLAQTELSYRVQGTTTYTIAPLIPANITTYQFSGLIPNVAYEWRVRNVQNGQYTSYIGPVSASQFTTIISELQPPFNLVGVQSSKGIRSAYLTWNNSGENNASTLIQYTPAGGSTYNMTVGPLVSSATVPVPVYAVTQFAICHTETNFLSSPFTDSIFVNIARTF